MKTKPFRKVMFGFSAAALSCLMVLSGMLPIFFSRGKEEVQASPALGESIKNVTGMTDLDLRDYLDSSVSEKLPQAISPDREISVMVALDTPTVLDGFEALGQTSMSVSDYAESREGKSIRSTIERESRVLQADLTRKGIEYQLGVSYDMLLSGFEIVIRANQFEALQKAIGKKAGVFISEEYSECKTFDVVENEVNVHDTGIFNSEGSEFDGSGTVIAVLDSGLDYTHDVFNPSRFEGKQVITQDTLRDKVSQLSAAQRTPGLTASDVYINKKVPYAYDYADSDPDVYPVNSDHGTHVSGIIVGKSDPKYKEDSVEDNYIIGVAPNAQLAFFKVFSESQMSAKQSWIVSALEDCVALEVDVINMSLGSASGFTREVDDKERAEVYDKVREHGISLIAAAGNEGSSASGSTKNGNLPLSTNPDTSNIGAPSSYDSALSVASISGIKTPFVSLGDDIIYFINSRNFAGEERFFVDEILPAGVQEKTFEYVVIPGTGVTSNYNGLSVEGKIALVERGVTNFEDKAQVAKDHGAAGCIIYNNTSGDITMTIGSTELPTCSVNRDDGLKLVRAASSIGKITISRQQVAGPFMSDFSSWGPTPDLGIKPEITAHGGDILSSIPGGKYDRFSGTSMASPNQAGLTALVREYVKSRFPDYTPQQVMAMVNQLMMSTADIAYNSSNIPFSVRKQGAGLANLTKATSTPAFMRTFDRETGEISDKAKIELYDDPDKTGEYQVKFQIVNIGDGSVTYDVGLMAQTEGISEILTYRGDTTITEKGYVFDDARITVNGVEGGTVTGNKVTVNQGDTATVTATITLSDADKEYMNSQFANGIYVEGYVTLTNGNDISKRLNVPFLTFFGNWAQAPLFDLDFFETYADEQNDSLLDNDKKLPDYISTIPLGGLYNDYIAYLGTFPYLRDPSSSLNLGAEREKIALTNQVGEYGGINSIKSIWFGLLRGAKKMEVTITDSTTGEVVFSVTDHNLIKSFNNAGAGHVYSSMDIGFSVKDHNLKNNTRYDVKAVGYLDYGDGGINDNLRNVFEFPFYTDFEAPIATGVEYTYKYDRESKTNKLYANISIYDNQYLMGYIGGSIGKNSDYDANNPEDYLYTTDTFSSYVTPVLGERNSVNVIEIELTDQLEKIRNSHDGRSFMIQVMDYALNSSTYEFSLPDEITAISFPEMKEEEGKTTGIVISPNETYRLNPETTPAQDQAWRETIIYTSSDENVAKVVEGQVLGVSKGTAVITATSAYKGENGVAASATLNVTVLGPEDEGYKRYDKPVVEDFYLDGYFTNKVFYMMNSEDRGLNIDKARNDRGERNYIKVGGNATSYAVSMFPSESIQLNPIINGFYDSSRYHVRYSSSNQNVIQVEQDGTVTAKNVLVIDGKEVPQNTERTATVSISLEMMNDEGEWQSTYYSASLYITVKKPYETAGSYLLYYRGLGGTVEVPESMRLTVINSYAFSNTEFIDKDFSAGDIIDDEDPYTMKQWFIGDDSIEKVILPEGIETVESYAFAGLTNLKEVVLPSTLYKLQIGAFYGCRSLEKVTFSGANGLQFVNEKCFYQCGKLTTYDFTSMVGIGASAFEGTGLVSANLPAVGSIGARAFYNCGSLQSVTMGQSSVKFGSEAFGGCSRLSSVSINAKVIPNGTFEGCTQLSDVTLGADVEVIGQSAFRSTKVRSFALDNSNRTFTSHNNGEYLVSADGTLALVAPMTTKFDGDDSIKKIGKGAFSTAGESLGTVNIPSVTEVEDYAFANCTALTSLNLGTLTKIGEGAFQGTSKLSRLPNFAEGAEIEKSAFEGSGISVINLDHVKSIGEYAFANSGSVTSVTIGENVQIGKYAFYGDYALSTVKIGNGCDIGESAFAGLPVSEVNKALRIKQPDDYFVSGLTFEYNHNEMQVTMKPFISGITSLTIGDNVRIGYRAFYAAGSIMAGIRGVNEDNKVVEVSVGGVLEKVTLGEGTMIGDYAFFGSRNIKTVEGLEKAKSIGQYAFSGQLTGYLNFTNGILEVTKINMAAQIEKVDLSAAEYVGKGAFAGNTAVKNVTLNPNLTQLGISPEIVADEKSKYIEDVYDPKMNAGVFDGCTALESVSNLGNLDEIGDDAFCNTALTSISLKEGVKIGNYAFTGAEKLATVENLGKATYIGDYAFFETALTSADTTSATYIGDFAFARSKVESVVFGNSLTGIGENPFARCKIADYTRDGSNTFDIGTNGVKVIDSAIYRKNVKGMELVSFPMAKEVSTVDVASKTNRICAEAFYGSKVQIVTLAREVQSIGHLAFYGCDNLLVVTFTSIQAPRLEEEYDVSYEEFSEYGTYRYMEEAFANVLITSSNGDTRTTGLGYVDAIMWSPGATCVLYGGNFLYNLVDEKHQERTLIMVRPSNGTGYDSFTFQGYFDQVVIGRGAITDTAQTVIDMVDSLPSNLSASDHDTVYAIYDLYNALNIEDQNYLTAEGYSLKISNAKRMIDSLAAQGPSEVPPEEPEKNNTALYVVLGIVAGGIVIALVVYFIQRKSKGQGDQPEASDQPDREKTENDQPDQEKTEHDQPDQGKTE